MNETLDTIDKLIAEELERAGAIHKDYFASAHEGESVIREEVEEAIDNIDMISAVQARLWASIKNNDNKMQEFYIGEIRKYAKEAIKESIQVAAMCDKFINTVRELAGGTK